MPPLTALTCTHTHTSSKYLSFHLKISLHIISDTAAIDSCLLQNHDSNVSPSFSTVSQSLTGAAQALGGGSVKMAVLIRWRIRAVVFNQSRQWQNLWCSRGDCDADSCWRGKHRKYTCSLICFRWSRAYSAMSVLRAAFWEKRWKWILELQKHMGLYGHAAGTHRDGKYSQVILFLSHETWYCLDVQ